MAISTRSGVDIIYVTNRHEASECLKRIYDETSLSRKEISEIVSLNGISVSDVVRCYNDFIKGERKVISNADTFKRVA